MTVEDCLPENLRGPQTQISKIAAGMSGAGVYRVESAGEIYVLKIATERESDDDWRRALAVQELAAQAGLAPRIFHIDRTRRAILTAFVVEKPFVPFYWDPRSHEAALDLLGRTVRRIHALPLPADFRGRAPREFLVQVVNEFLNGFAVPRFAQAAIQRMLDEEPPQCDRATVLSHNDMNPTNIIYDGESLFVLDFATAGPMDPYYDLAVLSVFLRMEAKSYLRLLSAYDDAPVVTPPARFLYDRRISATLVGALQLYLARQLQHDGATGQETRETTLSLVEFYQRLRSGALAVGTKDGQWSFGLAMLKESLSM